ncbi:MAG: hypothetical protein J6X49_06615 [Victivallales bacterium]|nr:hypothetical protein [Victivallales bacterium]
MNNGLSKIFAGIFLVIVAVIVCIFLMPSEKKKVLKQLDNIIESVNKKSDEGNIAAAAKNLAFGNLLDDSQEISIIIKEFPYNGSHSATELASLAAQGRLYCTSIDIRLKGSEVEIEDDTATIDFTAAFTVVTKYGGKYDEIRPFTATLRKIDKKWKFNAFQDKQVLKK